MHCGIQFISRNFWFLINVIPIWYLKFLIKFKIMMIFIFHSSILDFSRRKNYNFKLILTHLIYLIFHFPSYYLLAHKIQFTKLIILMLIIIWQ